MKKNPKLRKLWSKRHLPEELWPLILSSLPVKTLVRFRSVSKSWRALIDNPDFVRLHLLRFPNNNLETHLVLSEPGNFTLKSAETLKTTAKLHLLQTDLPSVRNWSVSCSIDGLFILRSGLHVRLWNPSIRKTLILPPINPRLEFEFGLGFDPVIKDYKHVRLVLNPSEEIQSIAVYSVGTNSLRLIQVQDEQLSSRFESIELRSFCLKGFLIALASFWDSEKLLSFDLINERFACTNYPIDADDSHTSWFGMTDDECSLASIKFSYTKGSGSIWVLEGLGGDIESWSWSKRYTIASMIPGYDNLTGNVCYSFLRKNGEVFFTWDRMITSYNIKTRKEKIILRKRRIRREYKCEMWSYKESLVLLK